MIPNTPDNEGILFRILLRYRCPKDAVVSGFEMIIEVKKKWI
jgi:hypothetical protein